jgi:hypothetical protein
MKKKIVPLMLVIFVVLCAVVWGVGMIYRPFDTVALITGNALMAVLSISSILMIKKQLHARPQAFVRGVSGASFLKLIVCGGGILAYAFAQKPNVDKPTLLAFLGIYTVYAVVETLFLSRMAQNNAGSNQ